MPVAKTYATFAIDGEQFQENGKVYVNVITPKGLKKVRWYTDAEYKRMYHEAIIEKDLMDFDARHAFGFGAEGYITLYKGDNVEDWANEDRTNIRYNCTFGFYTPGRLKLPNIINGIEPIQLNWNMVAINDTRMKSHEEVHKLVMELLNEKNKSKYQGIINDWLQKEVRVKSKKSQDGRYGLKHVYTLEDSEGNIYVWETGAKDYNKDKLVSLKMKVKEHKEIDNNKVTVVWYCKEV